jgi:hypothetical protein
VLDERALADQALELLVGEELVVDAVDLAGSGVAGGGGHAELELGDPLAQGPDQRALAHP